MPADTSMRRRPLQARGVERVNAILDAAAQLFAEIGYDAATTNAIAERANTRIGSLYRFFPNKEAILDALAQRYLDDLRALHDRVMNPALVNTVPLPALIDTMIDAFADFDEQHKGFRGMFYGSQAPAHLAVVSEEIHRAVVGRVEALLAARFPALDAERRSLTAAVSVAVVKAVMPLAGSPPQPAVLAELKRLLLAYLSAAGA